MICKELNRDFATTADMYAALKIHKSRIISLKKAAIKCSDPIDLCITTAQMRDGETIKNDPGTTLNYGDHIYPVINTTNYLDSHGDLHLNGIWNKSATEQNGKTYYLINHDLSIGKVISYPADVEIMVKNMAWKDLGRDYDGSTEALIFKAKLTEDSNADAYRAIKGGAPIQNSIRMVYVNLDLAINQKGKEYVAEKKLWDQYYPDIANKTDADEAGYFWAIYEAKIYKEGSAVLFGSNDATGILYDEPKHGSPDGTRERAAADRTRVKVELNNLLKKLKK